LIKFSLAIPLGVIEPAGEFQSQEGAAHMGRALEASGAAACYVTDHPAPVAAWLHAHGHDATDPFTSLSFVAAATTSLRLHTNVVVLPYRNPFITAKAAAILQVFSGGRLILGVGAGYQQGEFEALGIDYRKRDVLTDEALETIRLAWSGGPVVKQGHYFKAAGNEPRPVPKPHPTLWVGGGSDRAVQRAAKWGDGWSPFFTAPTLSPNNRALAIQSVEQLAEKIRVLAGLRAKMGKSDPFDICIGPRVPIKTMERLEAERYIEAVGRLVEIGVNWITTDLPHPNRAAYLEAVHWFGEEVVKRFQRSPESRGEKQ
jgi:probable F420-dependent oxidoreductase